MVTTTFCTSDGSAVSPSWWAAVEMRRASSTSRLLSPSGAGAAPPSATRQSSTPLEKWNCRAVIGSVMC